MNKGGLKLEDLYGLSVEIISSGERDALKAAVGGRVEMPLKKAVLSNTFIRRKTKQKINVMKWHEKARLIEQTLTQENTEERDIQTGRIRATNVFEIVGGDNDGRKFWDNLDFHVHVFKLGKEECDRAAAEATDDDPPYVRGMAAIYNESRQAGQRLASYFKLVGEDDQLKNREEFPGWVPKLVEHFAMQKGVGKTFRLQLEQNVDAKTGEEDGRPKATFYNRG